MGEESGYGGKDVRDVEKDDADGGNGVSIADDLDGDPVYLARNDFYLGYTRDRSPGITFTDVKDRHADAA